MRTKTRTITIPIVFTIGIVMAIERLLAPPPWVVGDNRRIRGDWYEHQILSADRPPGAIAPGALHFDGYSTFSRSGTRLGHYAMANWTNPRRIALEYDRNGPAKGLAQKGVYKFVGDALVICVADPCPTDFALPKGSGRVLTVYRRRPTNP
jgi:uncharacterized protein (TIGR03067 family)